MGKRVNFCARSVVTCDSYIDVDEVMIPYAIAGRLTSPVVVHRFNIHEINSRLRAGQVLFLQRSASGSRMRSITHVAMQNFVPNHGDCLLRRGRGRVRTVTLQRAIRVQVYHGSSPGSHHRGPTPSGPKQ